MPDLLGLCPCEGCDKYRPPTSPDEEWTCDQGEPCGPYAAYAAKRELLEALKARAEYICNSNPNPCLRRCEACFEKADGPGHLVFIPEAQE